MKPLKRLKTSGSPGKYYYVSTSKKKLWSVIDKLRKGISPESLNLKRGTIPPDSYSIWVTDKYIHGPRIRQPDEFESLWIVPYKYARNVLKIKLDRKKYPPGTLAIIGKLKTDGLAQQSTLIPIKVK